LRIDKLRASGSYPFLVSLSNHERVSALRQAQGERHYIDKLGTSGSYPFVVSLSNHECVSALRQAQGERHYLRYARLDRMLPAVRVVLLGHD